MPRQKDSSRPNMLTLSCARNRQLPCLTASRHITRPSIQINGQSCHPNGRREKCSYWSTMAPRRGDQVGKEKHRGHRWGGVYTLSLIHISEPTRLGMISYAVFCLK